MIRALPATVTFSVSEEGVLRRVSGDEPDRMRRCLDAALAASAREAIATIRDVKADSEKARGERPLDEDTVVRGFSRLAYEAITVPELDLLEDVDISELEEVR